MVMLMNCTFLTYQNLSGCWVVGTRLEVAILVFDSPPLFYLGHMCWT